MSPDALVLAAHGSRRAPEANAWVERCASELRRRGRFTQVVAAFHQGDPPFRRILDRLTASRVTVVPFMTSKGYYSDTVLPRELAKNRCYGEVELRLTPPVGLHPDVSILVLERVRRRARSYLFDLQSMGVAVVGHGTRRHQKSRRSTLSLVAALKARSELGEVEAFFLDEPPRIEEIPQRFSSAQLLVVPFLMGASAHAGSDIPRRLGLPPVPTAPVSGAVGNRTVVVDDAVGTDPGMVEIVTKLALQVPSDLRLEAPDPRYRFESSSRITKRLSGEA